MKNMWKWILGIVLVLVVVGSVAAVAFAWRDHVISVSSFRAMPFAPRWDNPMPRDFDGWRHGPMRGPRGGGFGIFNPFMFLGGLVRVAFFGALLYGAYWLGKRNARIVLEPVPVAPSPPTASHSHTEAGSQTREE